LIDNYLSALAREKNFSGALLIIKDGEKIFSKGYGYADKEKGIFFNSGTLASMGSITKAFTAAAIMKLCEQNKLSTSDKLSKFFPGIPSDKADITIHELLTHSSGFHEFLKNDGGDYQIINTEDYLKQVFAEPLAFNPGEKAVYTNVGMSVLAIIIEKVSGIGYEQYLKKYLFEPAGIKKIGYRYPVDNSDTIAVGYRNGIRWGTLQEHIRDVGGGPYWNLKGNGGLEASLDDMFLWANSLSNHIALSEASVQKMFTSQVIEEGYGGKSSFGYGCNILKSRRNTKMIDNGGSNGVYFARLIRLPEEGLIFYMVTNESTINTNMVLPNVTQLYFTGEITMDELAMEPKFGNEQSKKIYDLILQNPVNDLANELKKNNIIVNDDMILLEVGQALTEEKKTEHAFMLYSYYTKAFPNIVIAWNELGELYEQKSMKDEAVKCYRQALIIRPGNARAKENLSRIKE
jgi:CubicO group peptidase (beta-lactamase class C family)